MLRKKSKQQEKRNVKRKYRSHPIEQESVVAETKKKVLIPLPFAGFHTCFNFLKMPLFEEEDTKQAVTS